jgi:hypothetical protein
MNTRELAGITSHYRLAASEPPAAIDYVVLVFPRGGPPFEVAREPHQWMAQAVAFEERRKGTLVEIEERPRKAA